MCKQQQIFHKAAPSGGMSFMLSNSSSIAANSGKVLLDCPVCGISFLRYACWAKRKKVSYCGKGCADEAKRRPTAMTCVVCAKEFVGVPSEVGRIVTCSKECRVSDRRRKIVAKPPQVHANRASGTANAKLTTEQVREIESSTERTGSLALQYGVSDTLVRNLRRAYRLAQP
jgi:hypothetical protein